MLFVTSLLLTCVHACVCVCMGAWVRACRCKAECDTQQQQTFSALRYRYVLQMLWETGSVPFRGLEVCHLGGLEVCRVGEWKCVV